MSVSPEIVSRAIQSTGKGEGSVIPQRVRYRPIAAIPQLLSAG